MDVLDISHIVVDIGKTLQETLTDRPSCMCMMMKQFCTLRLKSFRDLNHKQSWGDFERHETLGRHETIQHFCPDRPCKRFYSVLQRSSANSFSFTKKSQFIGF